MKLSLLFEPTREDPNEPGAEQRRFEAPEAAALR